MSLDDGARRLGEEPDTAVVTEPRPGGEALVRRRGGERGGIGVAGDEAFEVRDHRRDLRLLEHRLRYEHAPGVAVAPPGQVAAMFREPGREKPGDAPRIGGGGGRCHRAHGSRERRQAVVIPD